VNVTTQGLIWGVDDVSVLELQADAYFEDIRKKFRLMKFAKLPPEMVKLKADNDPNL
jgi:hypothetical protein